MIQFKHKALVHLTYIFKDYYFKYLLVDDASALH